MTEQPAASVPARVLVAEDSPTQAELLRDTLAAAGYAVKVVGNGVEAVEAARRVPPAVIVSDVVMPDMDGYALCRAVRADAALRAIPLMLVTSLDRVDDIVRALECGADHFIRKPFDPAALVERVRYLLANRAERTQLEAQPPIEVHVDGRTFAITAGREQILDLLFSSYQEAVQANTELRQRQQEIHALNRDLAARAVQLEEANRQLSAFSHTVSHDLRSPLATISGFSSILQHKYAAALEANALRYVGAIEQESRRSLRIVDDILYLANIDRSRVTRSSVDLAALARQVVEGLRRAQPQRQVHFDAAPAAPARCDEKLVRILLENLLGNAWKFTAGRATAHIEFGVEQQGDEPVYCVRDDGAGFDMAYAHRLFKPFERLHRQDEFEGHGVGLATVQRIVALHGGRVWAESTPGKGACFRFTLGQAAEQERSRP